MTATLTDDEKRVDAMILKLGKYSIAQMEAIVLLMGCKLPTRIKLNEVPDDMSMRRCLTDYNISLKDVAFPVRSSKRRARSQAAEIKWTGEGEAEWRARHAAFDASSLDTLDRLTQILRDNVLVTSNAVRLAANKAYGAQLISELRAEKTTYFTEYCERTLKQCQESALVLESTMAIVVEVANATSSALRRITAQDEDILPLPDTRHYFATDIWPKTVRKIIALRGDLYGCRNHINGFSAYADRPFRRHDEILPAPDFEGQNVNDDDDPALKEEEEEPPLKKKKTK